MENLNVLLRRLALLLVPFAFMCFAAALYGGMTVEGTVGIGHNHRALTGSDGENVHAGWLMIPTQWDQEQTAAFARVMGVEVERYDAGNAGLGGTYMLKVPAELGSVYESVYAFAAGRQKSPAGQDQGRCRILVRFTEDVSPQILHAFSRFFDAQLMRRWERLGVHEFSVPAHVDQKLYKAWLRLSPYVDTVEANMALPQGGGCQAPSSPSEAASSAVLSLPAFFTA